MSSVDVAIMLKLRAIRNCAEIHEKHMQSPEVLAYLQNEDKNDDEPIPQISYDLKAYPLRELCRDAVREEILAGEDQTGGDCNDCHAHDDEQSSEVSSSG